MDVKHNNNNLSLLILQIIKFIENDVYGIKIVSKKKSKSFLSTA